MSRLEPPSEPPEVRMVRRWKALVEHGIEGEPPFNPFEDDKRDLYDLRDVEGRPE